MVQDVTDLCVIGTWLARLLLPDVITYRCDRAVDLTVASQNRRHPHDDSVRCRRDFSRTRPRCMPPHASVTDPLVPVLPAVECQRMASRVTVQGAMRCDKSTWPRCSRPYTGRRGLGFAASSLARDRQERSRPRARAREFCSEIWTRLVQNRLHVPECEYRRQSEDTVNAPMPLRAVSRPIEALRRHWQEYLIEMVGLGVFMVSAGVFTTLLEYPGSSIRGAIADAWARRALIGLAMGATSIALIYSPWGGRSGAHFNPAVTLTFYRLGKVAPWDAAFYIGAQFLGGLMESLVRAALGQAFGRPPVDFAVTVPGPLGLWIAFTAEFVISFGLMTTVLCTSNNVVLMRYTGLFSGLLVTVHHLGSPLFSE